MRCGGADTASDGLRSRRPTHASQARVREPFTACLVALLAGPERLRVRACSIVAGMSPKADAQLSERESLERDRGNPQHGGLGGSGDRQKSGAQRRVLLIEDDPRLLRALARVLEFDGFRVSLAADAQGARVIACEHGAEFALIITDIILPDASAIELARELACACAGAPILFMSGSPTQGGNLPAFGVPSAFLPKPFSPADLKLALRALKVL
jgi:CheY-like chemotaxis protein